MNIEKLRNKSLSELYELKTIITDVCRDYSEGLTNYAVMSADPQFQKMPLDTQKQYHERGIFVGMLNDVKAVIKEKLFVLNDE